jgi:hypothetical protein
MSTRSNGILSTSTAPPLDLILLPPEQFLTTISHHKGDRDSDRISITCYTDTQQTVEVRLSGSYSAVRLEYDLPPTAYRYNFTLQNGMILGKTFYAGVIKTRQASDGTWEATYPVQGMNIYSGGFGKICWGVGNSAPTDFNLVASAYSNSPFNRDLTNETEVSRQLAETVDNGFSPLPAGVRVISEPSRRCDAILVADRKAHHSAHRQLYCSGLDPLRETNSPLIILPMIRHNHRGINGFISPITPIKRCWFATPRTAEQPAQLLGQIPPPIPCSTESSRSAPAEPEPSSPLSPPDSSSITMSPVEPTTTSMTPTSMSLTM